MSRKVHSPTQETGPSRLLHNIGGPARAAIVWNGYGRARADGRVTATRGAWLHLCAALKDGDTRRQWNWNSACSLLRLLEPGHQRRERAAHDRLCARLEARAATLDWPPVLLARQAAGDNAAAAGADAGLVDTELAFLALAKSTGTVWRRDRAASLILLHRPGTRTAPEGGTYWSHQLWFADGLPASVSTHPAFKTSGAGAAP